MEQFPPFEEHHICSTVTRARGEIRVASLRQIYTPYTEHVEQWNTATQN